MELTNWSKLAELGGYFLCLFAVLFYVFRYHVPRLMDTFENSLDKITERHSESMNQIGESISKMTAEISTMRTSVEICKFRQPQPKKGID